MWLEPNEQERIGVRHEVREAMEADRGDLRTLLLL